MTRTIKRSAALALVLALMLSLAACGAKAEGLWANATYTEDTELRQALEENSLIAGDESDYGLYVKTVDGMTADYDADGLYWAFYKSGEYLMTGVDTTEIADGEQYELVCTAA